MSAQCLPNVVCGEISDFFRYVLINKCLLVQLCNVLALSCNVPVCPHTEICQSQNVHGAVKSKCRNIYQPKGIHAETSTETKSLCQIVLPKFKVSK